VAKSTKQLTEVAPNNVLKQRRSLGLAGEDVRRSDEFPRQADRGLLLLLVSAEHTLQFSGMSL
jgi:hypothetical protein